MRLSKDWIALIGGLLTGANAVIADEVLDVSDLQQVIITVLPAIITMVAVRRVGNKSKKKESDSDGMV